jgi:hypothetical protein
MFSAAANKLVIADDLIAGQRAVLDEASLSGGGQSSPDVLDVPGAVLAERLTAYLLREIVVRGSGGGPLC